MFYIDGTGRVLNVVTIFLTSENFIYPKKFIFFRKFLLIIAITISS